MRLVGLPQMRDEEQHNVIQVFVMFEKLDEVVQGPQMALGRSESFESCFSTNPGVLVQWLCGLENKNNFRLIPQWLAD